MTPRCLRGLPASSDTLSARLLRVPIRPIWLIGFWSKNSSMKPSSNWKENSNEINSYKDGFEKNHCDFLFTNYDTRHFYKLRNLSCHLFFCRKMIIQLKDHARRKVKRDLLTTNQNNWYSWNTRFWSKWSNLIFWSIWFLSSSKYIPTIWCVPNFLRYITSIVITEKDSSAF